MRLTLARLAMALMLLAGCDTKLEADPDVLVSDQGVDQIAPDQGGGPDLTVADGPLPTAYKVAALQYNETDQSSVSACTSATDGTCGVVHFVKEAAQQGAKLVVVPSYATYPSPLLYVASPEALPAVGDAPLTDSRWPADTLVHTMAQTAVDEQITLAFTAVTAEGNAPNQSIRNTVLVVDTNGKVLAVHNVFQYMSGSEPWATEGTSLATSFYDSPIGKVGLLANADVQCIVTGMIVTTDCTQHARDMLLAFTQEKPDVVLLLTKWIGAASPKWQALAVFSTVATAGLDAWVIAANQRQEPWGNGGGMWRPDGTEERTVKSAVPTVVYADLPLKQQ